MLLPVFKDLIKPQWRAVLEELKLSGALPVSELAANGKWSYMAVKQHCEELKKLGYLDRSRVPRTAVGRPEIFYSLSSKADSLFPEAGASFTLDLLEGLKILFGENTPEKLLFQYFQKQYDKLAPVVEKEESLEGKVECLTGLRIKGGCDSRHVKDSEGQSYIEDYHNPLQRVFDRYPRAAAMEQRMIGQLLEMRVTRRAVESGRTGQSRVIFDLFPLA